MARRRQNTAPGPTISSAFVRSIRTKRERIEDASVWPWTLPILAKLEELALDPKITIIVGENGSGKSTFLEGVAVAAGMNFEGGGRNHDFSTTEISRSPMEGKLLLVRGTRRPARTYFFRAETFHNVASYHLELSKLPFSGETLHYLHNLSHGETFLEIVRERIHVNGFFILDEPESALSPQNLLILMRHIKKMTDEEGSQFVIATHSPLLMALPNALIYDLSEEGIKPIELENIPHFRLMKRFFGDHKSFVEKVMNDE